MFYFDSTLIDTMARERLSRHGQLINLDMNDYCMFASEREVISGSRSDLLQMNLSQAARRT